MGKCPFYWVDVFPEPIFRKITREGMSKKFSGAAREKLFAMECSKSFREQCFRKLFVASEFSHAQSFSKFSKTFELESF